MSFINSLSEWQIQSLPTDVLRQLKTDFHNELERRKQREVVEKTRLKRINQSKHEPLDRGIIERVNASALLAIPVSGNHQVRRPYLKALLSQDWSSLFLNTCDVNEKYYVYAHVDPTGVQFAVENEFGGNWGGTPFYIGKGSGQRAFDLKRNQMHGKLIAKAMKAGFEARDIVHIIARDLSESSALELEAKYIYFFGQALESKHGTLVNLDQSMIPMFTGEMTRYEKVKKENVHWIKQWKRDNAAALEGDKNGAH